MVNSSQSATSYSREEIETMLRSLTPADWIRLKCVSHRYARPEIEANDLLQEALTRALDGRKCPTHVDIVRFLSEAMRSIANGEGEKIEHRLVLVPIEQDSDKKINSEPFNYSDPSQTADAAMISEEDEAKIRHDILALFDDDPVAQDVLEGIMEDLSAIEIRQLTDLNKTDYDSKRKLIRRRIDKKYPQGWKL